MKWWLITGLILALGCSDSETGETVSGGMGSPGQDWINQGQGAPSGEPTLPGESTADGTIVLEDTDTSSAEAGCGPECPAQLCDRLTGACKECNVNSDCDILAAEWCDAGTCVKTLCIPGEKECISTTVSAVCSADGTAWEETQCESGDFCVFGECKSPICTPGETTCGYEQKKVCNETGTAFQWVPCPPGFGCKEAECVPIKNNVVVVMDTSGSMAAQDFSLPIGGILGSCESDADCSNGEKCCADALFGGDPTCQDPANIPFGACTPPGSGGGGLLGDVGNVTCVCGDGNCKPQDFPQCESLDCPISKLGLAKYTLANLINDGEFDAANVVLHRFPQAITPNPSLQCGIDVGFGSLEEKRGWYVAGPMSMSGDNGQHITVAGDYFDTHLHEILSVPFPVTADEDTLAGLYAWIDGDETMEATDIPCSGNNDCPGGYCGKVGSDNVCHYHGSPELRALGGTPLGASMFYAGEYIRRHMVVDGKNCEVDADCENVNYYCNPDSKRCFDPLSSCRKTVIVLLSDGVGEEEEDYFFEPDVTAKRLRYGLGCEADADCGKDAVCQGGSCQGYTSDYAFSSINYSDATQGVERLYRYDGKPLEVTTHTIFISNPGESGGSSVNREIAAHGGGLFFDVATDSPSGLVDAINSILDVKENISECVPFLPEGVQTF